LLIIHSHATDDQSCLSFSCYIIKPSFFK